jgi:hypothetical protein
MGITGFESPNARIKIFEANRSRPSHPKREIANLGEEESTVDVAGRTNEATRQLFSLREEQWLRIGKIVHNAR